MVESRFAFGVCSWRPRLLVDMVDGDAMGVDVVHGTPDFDVVGEC